MRLTPITFSGYQSGHTDFAEVFDSNPEAEREAVLSLVERIANGIIDPNSGQFTSVIVVGHSDRQDDTSLSCDQRRTSEIEAATNRANSAWNFLKDKVAERLTQSGISAADWPETAPSVTWALVYAAAGMLKFDPPTQAQRPLNRRVMFLVSMFDCA
jgi:flagellar motor protein MotB